MRLVPFFVKLSYQIGIAGFRERRVGDLTLQSEISDVFRACIRKVPRETYSLEIMALVTRRAYLTANANSKHKYISTP